MEHYDKIRESMPEIIRLVKENELVDNIDEHPASQKIAELFFAESSSIEEKLSGCLIKACLSENMEKPDSMYIKPDPRIGDNAAEVLSKFATGEVNAYMIKDKGKRQGDEKLNTPLMGAQYAFYKVMEDHLGKELGEFGQDLARSLSAMLDDRIPLQMVLQREVSVGSKEGAAAFVKELEKQGINPLEGVKVLQIGGDAKLDGTDVSDGKTLTGLVEYGNIGAGGKYANRGSRGYIDLENMDEYVDGERFDYVFSANVCCPVVVRGTDPMSEAPFFNGDMFLTSANLVKEGGLVIHTNEYDAVNSPPLVDPQFHDFAQVDMVYPESSSVASSDNVFMFRPEEARQETTLESYKEWFAENGKASDWRDQLLEAQQTRDTGSLYRPGG